MRIGIATSHLHNLGGGASAVFWHLSALRDLGHHVTVMTRNFIHPIIANNWMAGVPWRQYFSNPQRDIYCERDFDVVVNIDHFQHAYPFAKKEVISHVFFPMDHVPPPPDGVRIYANSKFTAEHVRYRWGKDCDVLYIPIRNGFYEGQKENTILHVSRFSEPNLWADKGHRQMIQVFRMYASHLVPNGWRLVLAGALDPDQESYMNELAVLGAGLPIDIVHNATDQQLMDLYSKASIYWHATGVSLPGVPSAQEHLGLSPLEASASGCVPIAFNSGGMPEVIRHGETGMLYDDERQMGQLVLELSENWSLWSYLSQKGKRWASAWQNYPAFVDRVERMLDGKPIPELPFEQDHLKYHQEDVTVVIPTLESPLLRRCLQSIKETAPNVKLLLMNNGKQSAEFWGEFGSDNWIEMVLGENRGFSGALKVAEQIVKTPLVLLLNDDVIAKRPGWLEAMLFEMNDPKVGVTGAKLLFGDGRLQHAGGAVDWNRPDFGFHRWYGMPDHVTANQRGEVPFVTGACMLMRRELFSMPEELMDGLYMEELWISNVARERGLSTVYQPIADLYHVEGETRARTPESSERIDRNRDAFGKRWAR